MSALGSEHNIVLLYCQPIRFVQNTRFLSAPILRGISTRKDSDLVEAVVFPTIL
jgi:hypothetical protein